MLYIKLEKLPTAPKFPFPSLIPPAVSNILESPLKVWLMHLFS